ncbi:DUF6719 family protein [Neorhizobium huautlense]|uniref:DUF6719 family protein n=1 Tax=Neorhizobium huautlense TaxID=67774 RepID=UPI000CF97398|nr:DUF6719 family protein [Neorhizobium huautlense]
MTRLFMMLLSTAILLAPLSLSPAYAQNKTVTTKPTVDSIPAGRSVLYNDGKCPTGQIARYTKSRYKEQMGRKCVHITGFGK